MKDKNVHMAEEKNMLQSGSINVYTDYGNVILSSENLVFKNGEYYYENDFANFQISIYDKNGKTHYRELKLLPKRKLTLYQIDFTIYAPQNQKDFIFYKTFINAPAAAFIRCEQTGFYTGIENPFFSAVAKDNKITLSYQPSLILEKDEIYQSEPQFLGAYVRSYTYLKGQETFNLEGLKNGIVRSRFFNPCAEIALDYSEIQAMREYVLEYYNVIEKEFNNILYFFFYPKKQFPQTDEEIEDYYKTIDRFHALQGDTIVFNPIYKTSIPTHEKPYWELCPKNTPAEKILSYAQKKGLKCGFYIGCAINGDGGNAALLPFMPEKKQWKKVDAFGNTASENCIACDEYRDWFYAVQKNTIEKYDLGYWAWDPGPGNGNDCYAENHGHIPGKGEYKGWKNSQILLKKMKIQFPALFLQSFYGRKEYGIWGFRYFSQHEVYWEQTLLYGATLHNDFNDYRVNAHGTRLQNLWSMNYRFTPAHIGHGLVTRMGEGYYDPCIEKANDLLGWKYSLLSAIACCGSVTHCNLPDELENVPEMRAFYKKWIAWAKDNYQYCDYVVPISDNVCNGTIDGFARIHEGKGQLFFFNPSPLTIKKRLVLGEKLGFYSKDPFYLHVLYCENTNLENVDYGGEYKAGDCLEITIQPYGALVLGLSDKSSGNAIKEIPFHNHKIDTFSLLNGESFELFNHKAYESVTLCGSVTFHKQLQEILKNARVPNQAFLQENLEIWKTQNLPFNFLSSMPNRLLAYISFDGVKMPDSVGLAVNGKEVPVEIFSLRNTPFIHYAYLEDFIDFGNHNDIRLTIQGLAKDSFLGIYIVYPDQINGIETPQKIIEEKVNESRLHKDCSLVIDKINVSPDVITDLDCEYTITVETHVEPEKIEAVYCILPTQPQMPALTYNDTLKLWQGKFKSGNRRANIFCNSTVVAWIKSKDGGLGPKATVAVTAKYVYNK